MGISVPLVDRLLRKIGVKAPLPDFVEPQLTTLKSKPLEGNYLHEISSMVTAHRSIWCEGIATIYTRGGHNWTRRFTPFYNFV